MAAKRIRKIIKSSMSEEMYCKSGGVMLSGVDTLRPGKAYIMGLNPGGDPKAAGHDRSILDPVHERETFSCYVNECWQPRCTGPDGNCEHVEFGSVKPQFLVKHQRNAALIAEALGLNTAEIFSSNAVFARSTSRATLFAQTEHSLEQWWHACWPVHEQFLAVVRPRIIISLGYGTGSSAFGLLWQMLGKPEWRRIGDESRRGGWAFDANFEFSSGNNFNSVVVGVPHPSYMAIGPQLTKSLADL